MSSKVLVVSSSGVVGWNTTVEEKREKIEPMRSGMLRAVPSKHSVVFIDGNVKN
jgi:hypothetical protein